MRQRASGGAHEVLDARDDVLPRRRHRVLEVEHGRVRAGASGGPAEHVDDHLAVADGPGDLDAAREQVLRERRDLPVARGGLWRLARREVAREGAGVPLRLPCLPVAKQAATAGVKGAVQAGEEPSGLWREDAERGRRGGAGVERQAGDAADGSGGEDSHRRREACAYKEGEGDPQLPA